ncbi:hypothetical protein SAMN05444004_12320 [Jannaschia faecimaris]|uniref:Uncharacterized protein n=1 Tax=Jannaschia faecimaris TaxID=1244108 RepID=A0A1H3U4F6_9RHOB|nr:hypothetical protein SAMN05444004_12320 [Jannaschia faecimaris]
MSADTGIIWVLFVGSIFALLVFAMPPFVQSIPENANAKSYGDG